MLDHILSDRTQKGRLTPADPGSIKKDKKMQATSSPVPHTDANLSPIFTDLQIDQEPASYILPALKSEASAAGRDHLLVRRRRRGRRLQTR